MAYLLNDGGRFNVIQLANGTSLQVMGEGLQVDLSPPGFSRQPLQSQGFSHTGTGVGPMPMLAANYRAPIFGRSSKKKKAIAKVNLTEANKKTTKGEHCFATWEKHVNITEDTANITYIISKVRESFGDERLELFASNGLIVFDTERTRGTCICNLSCNKIPVFFYLSDR